MGHKSSAELQTELDTAAKKIKIGARYVHYKNLSYLVTGLAIIEATAEVGVIYQAEYGEHITFVRPLSSFLEQVELDGQTVSRFALAGPL